MANNYDNFESVVDYNTVLDDFETPAIAVQKSPLRYLRKLFGLTGTGLAQPKPATAHRTMASNYNRNFIPAAVLVNDGKAEYIVKPQTYEDLIRNDVIPERLKK